MSGRILVVEDEPSIAENVRFALESEGFAVDWQSTLGGARNSLAAAAPDLVVLDVGLPDGNGFDFCRELRATAEQARLPVLFLTARHEEVDRVVGLELGGDDYMVKPFSPRELTARVRAVLRRVREIPQTTADILAAKAASVNTVATGPWQVDDDRKRISFHGHALDLSKTEYRLLEALISRPGRVFSRDQLLEQAWDDPAASLDRTVDAHVKTVRAKLREAASSAGIVIEPAELIITHRGLGYSLKEDSA